MIAALPLIAVSPAASLRSKLAKITANESSAGPHQDIVLSSQEVNAYFQDGGKSQLPAGVSNLQLSSTPGEISGSADVDFDKVQAGEQGGGNPFFAALFSGVHHIDGRAHVDDANAPAAHLTVDSVAIDGQTIPNGVVDWAVNTFVKPKHPEIGRSFKVDLPKNVKSVEVGENTVTLKY